MATCYDEFGRPYECADVGNPIGALFDAIGTSIHNFFTNQQYPGSPLNVAPAPPISEQARDRYYTDPYYGGQSAGGSGGSSGGGSSGNPIGDFFSGLGSNAHNVVQGTGDALGQTGRNVEKAAPTVGAIGTTFGSSQLIMAVAALGVVYLVIK